MKKFILFLFSAALACAQSTRVVDTNNLPSWPVGSTNIPISVDSYGRVVSTGGGSGGSGTVTSVSVTTANGVSGSVATATTTPAITLTLGAITPTSVASSGSVSSGVGGAVAGTLELGQGTGPSAGTTSVKLYAGSSVTSYIRRLPSAAATGFYLGTNTAGDVVDTQVASNGTGNVILSAGTLAVASGKTLTVSNSYTTTATDGSTVALGAGGTVLYSGGPLGTPSSGVGTNLTALTAANITAGALANGMTATSQSAAENSTKLSTTAYSDRAALAGLVGTYATPDTTGGAVTLTYAVTEVWTNTTTTYALPAVASSSGKGVIFYVVGTNLVTIDPNASEIIVRDGTAQTGGVTMTLTGTAGNYVCMVCDGTRWVTLGFKGTLAAGS